MCSLALAEERVDLLPDHDGLPGRRNGLSLEDLEREICELAGHIAAATCRWLLLVAEFDERRGWAEWGVVSCAQWLSWRCSIGLVTAREHVRVAHRLGELPLVQEAFGRGELSYSKVRALVRVATPATEEDLVRIALHATGAQLEKLIRGYSGALAATLENAQRQHDRRRLTAVWEDDGSLSISANLPPEEGAIVLAALEAAAEDGRTDPDALVKVAQAALEATSECSAPDHAAPAEIVVHVDVESLVGDAVNERSELTNGPSLCPETVRRLGCDGSIVRILERDGRPLSVGRRKRTIPAALRRALRSRDGGCCFPGCTNRRFLHAHHIHHWARGGPTSLDNLVQLCSHHHRLVHEGGFGVERVGKHGLRFRRPDGCVVAPVPARHPVSGPGLECQNRVRGLAIDSRTCFPRSAGDRLDYDIGVMCLVADALVEMGRSPGDIYRLPGEPLPAGPSGQSPPERPSTQSPHEIVSVLSQTRLVS